MGGKPGGQRRRRQLRDDQRRRPSSRHLPIGGRRRDVRRLGRKRVSALEEYVPAAYDEVLTATAISDTDGLPGGLGGQDSAAASAAPTIAAEFFSNYATTAEDQVMSLPHPASACRPPTPVVSTVVPAGRASPRRSWRARSPSASSRGRAPAFPPQIVGEDRERCRRLQQRHEELGLRLPGRPAQTDQRQVLRLPDQREPLLGKGPE